MAPNNFELRRFLLITTFTLIACLSPITVAWSEPQALSNDQLAEAIHLLASQKRTLEAADHDYGGHRAAAVRDISKAENQLRDALQARVKAGGKDAVTPHIPEPQILSDQQLRQALPFIKDTIASLNAADHDYGGHRANAVRDLDAAHSQLDKALDYRHEVGRRNPKPKTHPVSTPSKQPKGPTAKLPHQRSPHDQGKSVQS